ncbi:MULTISPECIES: glycosyltransferase family 1 protein [unclassified Synechococcus]|uniref:glycosyltransferase family 4 protein n=1 Tax=unclassified Synechococcus TaxID=2626047 RepID=UPI000B991282|nr:MULTISPECIES: glycosyltransferase family 1 protein [unclassified Synechococcus]MCP9828367.1 glycosyltransferase family 1 protein [Synechococcus sp. L2F]MCP9847240.1 glycosyltransferase family 1 protein [Synechococcus sp. Lug-A]MCT0209571.1 glycosyltransferase family 1 protein [Synechococcus sp. CS-1333]PZV24735.1 MAG: glycosyltransferase family 1 protein [Cyanobium sp.]
MKIALFTETFLPKVDGIVTRLTKTVTHLVDAGDEVLLFCPEGAPDTFMGARVIGVPALPLPLYPELKLALPRPLVAEALDAFKPDLVHVVNPAVLGLGGIWLARTRGVPLVASYHTHLPKYLEHYGMGMFEPLLWELLKAAHNQAALNLCTSTAMVEELSQHGIQHTALWQRGVDTDLFRPEWRNQTMRSKLTGVHGDSDSLLLYVGRLSAEKQIERIRPVLDALPQARLALVGDGPHRQQLEKVFAGSATTFVGYLGGEDLASAYASADAFLFPSSTETLGLVLLEAMAAGCPVVGANRGGIPDIVTDGVNGCLYDPDSPASLTAATERLLASTERRQALRLAARAEAERWGWAGATQQLRRFYSEVVRPPLQLVA